VCIINISSSCYIFIKKTLHFIQVRHPSAIDSQSHVNEIVKQFTLNGRYQSVPNSSIAPGSKLAGVSPPLVSFAPNHLQRRHSSQPSIRSSSRSPAVIDKSKNLGDDLSHHSNHNYKLESQLTN